MAIDEAKKIRDTVKRRGGALMPRRAPPEEIRASIEQNRQELGTSVEQLRGEVVKLDRLARRSCAATSRRC